MATRGAAAGNTETVTDALACRVASWTATASDDVLPDEAADAVPDSTNELVVKGNNDKGHADTYVGEVWKHDHETNSPALPKPT